MNIIAFSDLHLEFGIHFRPPEDRTIDVMVLTGDIITFRDYAPLSRFLAGWKKPVIFVAGNHEFYTNTTMEREAETFQQWLATHPSVYFLQDQAITIDNRLRLT